MAPSFYLASARGLEKSDFSSSVDVGEGSHVHAGPLRGPGESLEKDVGSKSFIVKFLVKKVEIYKFVVLGMVVFNS